MHRPLLLVGRKTFALQDMNAHARIHVSYFAFSIINGSGRIATRCCQMKGQMMFAVMCPLACMFLCKSNDLSFFPQGLVEGFPGGFPGFPKGFPLGFQGFPHKRKGFPRFRPSKSRGFVNIPGVIFPAKLFAFIKLKAQMRKSVPPRTWKLGLRILPGSAS